VLSVVLVAVFLASPWWVLSVESPSGVGGWVGSGSLSFGSSGMRRSEWLVFLDRDFPFAYTKWWFSVKHGPAAGGALTILAPPGSPPIPTPISWSVHIPLWFPALGAALLTLHGWRLDARAARRSRTAACHKCGYSRSGLATGAACPECGAGSP
jgi:hypothetical protein